MHQKIKHSGFTLIELLVVIAIIGLLSTLAVVALNNARAKGRDAKRVSDIKSVQTALELYFADKNTYPVVASGLILGGTGGKTLSQTGNFSDTISGTTYMGKVPTNPTPAASACANYTYRSTNTDFTACTSGSCKSYDIEFCLEDITGSLAAGKHSAHPAGVD
ncbi:MAG: type II secretion system protein [Parcubacteria group bacterium]|nr:type II secretion system protein [Parcubacteria group bacterium]